MPCATRHNADNEFSMNISRKLGRRLFWWVVGILLFYTIVGFFVVPPLVRSVAQKRLSQQLGREVTIQQVKVNPFAFSATIRGLLIKEKNGDAFVSWDEVYARVQLSSIFQHAWVVKEVSTSNPYVQVIINPDGTFNFSDILARFSTNAPATAPKGPPKQLALRIDRINVGGATLFLKRDTPIVTTDGVAIAQPKAPQTTNTQDAILLLLQSVTNGFAALSQITNSFAACVEHLSVSNCTVKLEDLANPRPARLTVDEISVNGTNLSNVPLTNFAVAASLRWNTNGTLHSEITGSLGEPEVEIHLAFANLDLHPLDPYLDSKLSVFIIGSKLGMDGNIRLRGGNGGLPQVTFNGDTWLNDFDTVDQVMDEDLLKWSSVRISGIDAGLNPPEVAVHEMAIHDPYARLIIEMNRSINLLTAMRISLTNSAAQSTTSEKPKKLLAGDRVISNDALAQLPLKKFSIGSIVISNGSANFTDRSMKPMVNMGIEQISGSISGISSEELQHADVSLHAKVDNVGPVDITGTINPFSKDETNDIEIAVKDVDLTPLSPYSGKFAGYGIAKGKVSVALAYHLHGRNLKSENVITVDQFTFGEKVNSPDATKLPVRLGIAVLKDRDGKIVLDVPIEGSLDDPQFRLHKVIVRAIWNIVDKAITSPFAVLGAMFGGKGDEISYEDFSAGTADLTPASKEKLDVIIKALYNRPGLQLEISGSVDTNGDVDGLRALHLEKELRDRKWQTLRKADRTDTSPDQIVVSPEERPDLIKALYADELAKGLIVTSSTNGAVKGAAPLPSRYQNAGTERGATELLRKENEPAPIAPPLPANPGQPSAAITDPYEMALLKSISVTDDDFQALAADRAKAAREYILASGKVEGARLFITEDKTAGLKTQGSRVYLELQ